MKMSKNEVLADTMVSTANPYSELQETTLSFRFLNRLSPQLAFVRKGQEVIDTVKRVNIMMYHEKMREIK